MHKTLEISDKLRYRGFNTFNLPLSRGDTMKKILTILIIASSFIVLSNVGKIFAGTFEQFLNADEIYFCHVAPPVGVGKCHFYFNAPENDSSDLSTFNFDLNNVKQPYIDKCLEDMTKVSGANKAEQFVTYLTERIIILTRTKGVVIEDLGVEQEHVDNEISFYYYPKISANAIEITPDNYTSLDVPDGADEADALKKQMIENLTAQIQFIIEAVVGISNGEQAALDLTMKSNFEAASRTLDENTDIVKMFTQTFLGECEPTSDDYQFPYSFYTGKLRDAKEYFAGKDSNTAKLIKEAYQPYIDAAKFKLLDSRKDKLVALVEQLTQAKNNAVGLADIQSDLGSAINNMQEQLEYVNKGIQDLDASAEVQGIYAPFMQRACEARRHKGVRKENIENDPDNRKFFGY